MKKQTKARRARSTDFQSLTVGQVMGNRPQSVRLGTKADVIASLMAEGYGAVPVVDGAKKLVGIVSEHDLLAAIDGGHPLKAVTAGDIMTANPYAIPQETTLGTLVHVLSASDLVRVPVVDHEGKVVGIVARRDLLRTYLKTRQKTGPR
ncbi:MAG: CBS domain-containing protein [Nitrospira sp.]|nr:CBS domain-containing protein [Nitrospira sp.]